MVNFKALVKENSLCRIKISAIVRKRHTLGSFFDPRVPNILFYRFIKISDQKFEFFSVFYMFCQILYYLSYFKLSFEKKILLKNFLKIAQQILFLALLLKGKSDCNDKYTKCCILYELFIKISFYLKITKYYRF